MDEIDMTHWHEEVDIIYVSMVVHGLVPAMCLVSMRVMILLVRRTNMPPILSSTDCVSFRFSISCGKCVCLLVLLVRGGYVQLGTRGPPSGCSSKKKGEKSDSEKRRDARKENFMVLYCSCPQRTDFLDKRHKFKETNGVFNVAKGIRNTFGKGNATAKQAIDVKLARQGIELDSKSFAIHRYMRNGNGLVANGIDNEIATRHLLGIELLLFSGLSVELETLDIQQCWVRFLGPVGGQPLQSRIVI